MYHTIRPKRPLTYKGFYESGFSCYTKSELKKACEISETMGITITDYPRTDTQEILKYLSCRLGLPCIVIHLVDRACCRHGGTYYEVNGPYCTSPILTTGTDDNFNVSFLYGFIQNFSFSDCLYMGCATSGYYVCNGKGPTLPELIDFLIL